MKAQELRIHNLVYGLSDKNHSIKKVDKIAVIYQYGWETVSGKQGIEPIPLTEEWHNKFGVKRNGFNDFVYKINNIKAIIFSGDYVLMRDFEKNLDLPSFDDNLCTLWNNDERKRGMFVHEWQNMWYVLTGEELTLKETE